MPGGGGAMRHAAAPRPQLKVCYLCGQQFGSASIGIHVPQCYAKKVAQWEIGDPHTRGAKPKHPDTVDWKGSKGQSAKKLNDEQFREFENNLVPCPNCARTFLPDRLPVHLRGCKGTGKANANGGASRPTTRGASVTTGTTNGKGAGAPRTSVANSSSQKSGGASRGATPPRSASTSPARRVPGSRLVLPTCYLCGQQFGSASIGIHVPQCYAKKLAQWETGDPYTRGKAPRHPDEVNWRPGQITGTSGTALSMEEQSDAQFQEFVNNLEPCPNCGRKFLADRLVVHLRSCRPGHTAKRVGAPAAPSESTAASLAATTDALTPRPPSTRQPTSGSRPTALRNSNSSNPNAAAPSPPVLSDSSGRLCPRCDAVEADASAKYCRACGWNLQSRALPEPCARCHEAVPEGARFCTTCGEPVNGAAASERDAGGENANAPTVRVTVCPACKAICDADGNFCDNCGAALGGAEPSGREESPQVTAYMYCAACDEAVEDLSAVYCEDCGAKLQLMERQQATEVKPMGARAESGAAAAPRVEKATTRAEPKPEKERRTPASSAAAPRGTGLAAARALDGSHTNDATGRGKEVSDDFVVDEVAVEVERVECAGCGRRFTREALERHARVCERVGKQRPTFNMTKQRLADCDIPGGVSAGSSNLARGRSVKAGGTTRGAAAPKAPPTKDWRAESNAFREAMRNARKVDKVLKAGGTAKDLPPPTYSENAHYVPCPHCQRKFAPDVAERHIPRCANTVNRPKPPPRRR